jgi:hypothetical protein
MIAFSSGPISLRKKNKTPLLLLLNKCKLSYIGYGSLNITSKNP